MKMFYVIFLSIVLFSCNTSNEPGFVKKSFIGQETNELKGKFGNLMYTDKCIQSTQNQCKTAYKTECSCSKIQHSFGGDISIATFLTSINNKVVGLHHSWTTSEASFKRLLKPIKDYLGNSNPTSVFSIESSRSPRYQYYMLVWRYDAGSSMAQVACPKQLASNKKYLGSIGDCYLTKYWIRDNKDFSKYIGAAFKDSDKVEFNF